MQISIRKHLTNHKCKKKKKSSEKSFLRKAMEALTVAPVTEPKSQLLTIIFQFQVHHPIYHIACS